MLVAYMEVEEIRYYYAVTKLCYRYYEAGLAQPLDLDKISNYKKVSESLRNSLGQNGMAVKWAPEKSMYTICLWNNRSCNK